MAEFAAGSPAAFEEIVKCHQFAVRWQVGQMVGDSQAADDLAQDVFLDLIRARQRPGWSCPNSIRAWLLTVARNKAVDYVRAKSRRATSIGTAIDVADTNPNSTTDNNDHDSKNEERLKALEHCLKLLQPNHREVIEEFYSQAKSSELIAARIGKGASAVRMMLLRIRQALGKCIRIQLESKQ